MSKFNPFDYFFLLRPLILIPSWNFLLIGCYLAQKKGGFSIDIVIGLIIYTCLMGGVYIFNQITDIETDRANKKLFILYEGHVPVKHAYIEMVVLWVVAMLLSLKFSFIFLVFIGISLFLGVLYSLPPVKLKGKPVLDTLANSLGYGMINFAVGWLIVASFDMAMFIKFIPYFLSISAVFINTTVVDIEGDRKAGEITTAVLLGEQAALVCSAVLISAAIIAAYLMRDLVCLIPAALAFPFFVYGALYALLKNKQNRKLTIFSFRLPGLLFTLATVYLYPYYAVILLAVFLSMRVYYKKRFGLNYPTLAQG
ncbi:MAG: UbiA family prenyltransferase [bacterium]